MLNDSDLIKKSKKTCEKISENMYIIANEPSLACYRLQEHVHKSGPLLIDKMNEMKRIQKNLQGNAYDLEYSINALKAMNGTEKHFQNTRELLKNALFFKQQLNYEENVRMRVAVNAQQTSNTVSSNASATSKRGFQRFSGSFDLPSSFIPASIASVSASASADLKDLKSVLSQFASGAHSVSKRNRTHSLSQSSTKRHSEPPQISEVDAEIKEE